MKIRTVPDPVLRKKAKPVSKIDRKTQQLVAEMLVFLKKGAGGKMMGVGLAAPQIGISQRVIVVWSKGSRALLPMINPEIVWKSKRTKLGVPESKNPLEGCLSVPGFWGKVRRFSVIKISYLTPKNQKVIKKFKGITGVIVQHEADHLDGILFTDRIIKQGGKLLKQEND